MIGDDPKLFPSTLENISLIEWVGVDNRNFETVVILVSFFSMLLLHHLVHKTKIGKAMRAVSNNPKVAVLMGIPTQKIIQITFPIGSTLAGVGSVFFGMSYPKIEPLLGTMIGLKAIVAAVLGGIGSLKANTPSKTY